jgi:hypothetical protein
MRSFDLQPIAPFPGISRPWQARCLRCGGECAPRFSRVQVGGRGCRTCSSAEMSRARRLPEAEARALMNDAQLEPLVPYPGYSSPWRARCLRCGAICNPRLANVKAGGGGCPSCGRRRTVEARRADPEAAVAVMRSAALEPLEPYSGSAVPWLCRCTTCGHEVTPTLANVRNGTRCAYCSKQRVDPDEAAELMRAVGLDPLGPYPGAVKPWACVCLRCGKEVRTSYNSVQGGGRGCRQCGLSEAALRRRVPSAEALAVMESAGLTPVVPYPGAGKPWQSLCNRCGHEVSPSLASVRGGSRGCVWCAGQRLDEEAIQELMRSRNLEPVERYPGAMRPWRCRCLICDHEVSPTYNSIQQGSGGCGWCAKVKVDPDVAARFMRSAGLSPLVPYPGSSSPWPCECDDCGREVAPSYANVQKRGRGCRYCAPAGFAYGAPGLVYLLQHDEFYALKVGVTTEAAVSDRVSQHLAYGWRVLRTWETATGDEAISVEAAVLAWWRRELGAPVAVLPSDMPQGGYTETVSLLYADAERVESYVANVLWMSSESSA